MCRKGRRLHRRPLRKPTASAARPPTLHRKLRPRRRLSRGLASPIQENLWLQKELNCSQPNIAIQQPPIIFNLQLQATPSFPMLLCSPSLLCRLSNLLFLLHHPIIHLLITVPNHPLFQCYLAFRNAMMAHCHQHIWSAMLLWQQLRVHHQHHFHVCLLPRSIQPMTFHHPIPLFTSSVEKSRALIPAQQARLLLFLFHPPPTTTLIWLPLQPQYMGLSHHLSLQCHCLHILQPFLQFPA